MESLDLDMKSRVEAVVDGRLESAKFDVGIPCQFDAFIQRKYGVKRQDLDTNGWDWDFWVTYIIEEKKYTLAGSGWYGGISFARDQNEDDD